MLALLWTRVLYSLRDGWRTLRRNFATSALTAGALAVGIGLTTTMFGILNGFLFRGLPTVDAEQLVFLFRAPNQRAWMTPHDFQDYQAQQRTLEGLAAYRLANVNLDDDSAYPERYQGCYISFDAFELLGMDYVLGGGFQAEDDIPGAPRVAIIAHHVWRHFFESDPQIIGRSFRIDGQITEVVGVLPPGVRFPVRQEIFLPLRLDLRDLRRGEGEPLAVFGRLKNSVSRRAAQADVNAIAERLATSHPDTSLGRGIEVRQYTHAFLSPRYTRMFWTMQIAALIVLAVGCTKAASLILLQAVRQRRELGIRSAFGAEFVDVMTRTLSESLLLAFFGAAGGLCFAWVALGLYAQQMTYANLPYWVQFSIDGKAFLIATGASLAAALAAGLYPAWRAARDARDVSTALREGGRGSTNRHVTRFHRGLVIFDVALASALLVLTLLLIRSFIHLHERDLGIEPEKMFTARITLPALEYPGADERITFSNNLINALNNRPETDSVVVATSLPVSGSRRVYYTLEGRQYATLDDYSEGLWSAVTPGFFEAFNITTLQGRLFTNQDRADGRPVLIVNRSFAELAWPGTHPIGQRLQFGRGDPDEPWRTVVGVVPDAWMNYSGNEFQAGFYTPFEQTPQATFSIAVTLRDTRRAAGEIVREELQTLNRTLPIYEAWTMAHWMLFERADLGVYTGFYVAFGMAALGLAAVGLFGVLAFSVSQRTQEIGLRMALGSRRRHVLRLILKEGLRDFALGLILGLIGALGAGRLLTGFLNDVDPRDPLAFTATAVIFSTVAVIACLVPAWRASRVEPSVALHDE